MKYFLLKRSRDNSSIFSQFENPQRIPETLCLKTTGLNCFEFMELYGYLDSMNQYKNRTKSQALAVYLSWLKLGKYSEYF